MPRKWRWHEHAKAELESALARFGDWRPVVKGELLEAMEHVAKGGDRHPCELEPRPPVRAVAIVSLERSLLVFFAAVDDRILGLHVMEMLTGGDGSGAAGVDWNPRLPCPPDDAWELAALRN